jgi:hypothetical protein
MSNFFYRFSGADFQIADKCCPLDRQLLKVTGAYLFMLIVASSVAGIVAAHSLAVISMGLLGSILVDSIFGLCCIFILWNNFRLMLLAGLSQRRNMNAIQIIFSILPKLIMVVTLAVCTAVPLTMLLVGNQVNAVTSLPRVNDIKVSNSIADLYASDLDQLYQKRLTIREEISHLIYKDNSVILKQKARLSEVDAEITKKRLRIEAEINIALGRSLASKGVFVEVNRLVERVPSVLGVITAFVLLLYISPVVLKAVARQGSYAYLVEMQAIRNNASYLIVPDAKKIARKKEIIRLDKFLFPEMLINKVKNQEINGKS